MLQHVQPSSPANKSHEIMSASAAAAASSTAAAGTSGPGICESDSTAIVPSSHTPSHHSSESLEPSQQDGQIKIAKQSWAYATRSGVAGGIAACAAKTVVAPLDRVKILFQANNPQFAKYTGSWSGVLRSIQEIYRADGGRGLFRGHSATLLRIFPYGGIKFLAYEQIRAIVIRGKEQETSGRRFAAGAISGCISVFATYPLEVIRVRLAWETKAQQRVSVAGIVRTIYNERPPPPTVPSVGGGGGGGNGTAAVLQAPGAAIAAVTPRSGLSNGLSNFFRGFTPTLWGMVPYAGASFLTHDLAGDLMRSPQLSPYTILPRSERSAKQLAPGKPAPLRAWAELTTGAIAGFVSQTLSYPLEVVRRRMQVGGVVGDGHRLTMTEVAGNIVREKGWRGFYVGLTIGYVKVVPMVATSFYAYERLKVMFGI